LNSTQIYPTSNRYAQFLDCFTIVNTLRNKLTIKQLNEILKIKYIDNSTQAIQILNIYLYCNIYNNIIAT